MLAHKSLFYRVTTLQIETAYLWKQLRIATAFTNKPSRFDANDDQLNLVQFNSQGLENVSIQVMWSEPVFSSTTFDAYIH